MSDEVERVRDDVIEIRRDLHRNPELSHQEQRTAALAAQRCGELGFSVRTGVGGTGVVADLVSERPGPMLMLRADMDALPVLERDDGRPVRSQNDGVMHACGHDGHVAMTLGAAAVLSSMRDAWSGTLRCCFQPAEEIAGGAAPMIDAEAARDVDRVLGIHLWAQLDCGSVAVSDGVIFGSADLFGISVHGRGGHGGMPHTTADPVIAAAHVVTALQTLISRETSPFNPAVVTIGRISGGTAANVIADTVELGGTVRALEQHERERLLRRVAAVASDVAKALGCSAEYTDVAGTPPVVNDPEVAALVRRAAAAVVGEERVITPQPLTVGDDVALFLQQAPGCYFLVGAGNAEAPPHHSAAFDIDEKALPVGVETLVRAALDILR
ncbi:MAG: amidohydrolase [Candidatus Dormibacteraeota bacterium]|nr:amidohydrolase [Candidatus Dormibacteraeota bacterium]